MKRKTPIIYLAGPIRGVSRDEAFDWRANVSACLFQMGMASFNPAAAWATPNHHTNGQNDPVMETHLQVVNDMTVAMCDLMVVAFQGVESRGTDHEIELALNLYKPMIVYHISETSRSRMEPWYQRMFPDRTIPVYMREEVSQMVAAASNIIEYRTPPVNGYRPLKRV